MSQLAIDGQHRSVKRVSHGASNGSGRIRAACVRIRREQSLIKFCSAVICLSSASNFFLDRLIDLPVCVLLWCFFSSEPKAVCKYQISDF